jgi:outer membrane beta-barrel protein
MLEILPMLLLATLAHAESITDGAKNAANNAAKDTLDIGVLKDSEVKVVQKMIYTKEDKLELGAHLGLMPFDGYTVAPQLALTGAQHFSEKVAVELQVGGGYGFPSAAYDELGGPTYGVAVEAYRYLASAEVDVQYTPIYAKMNFGGKKVVHHDVYLLFGAGATAEQGMIPSVNEVSGATEYPLVIAPTVPVGIGTRIWLSKTSMLRAELRDSVLLEHRAITDTWAPKQNVALSVGIAVLLGQTK